VFELTTLLVIVSGCIGSYISNYHTITTTTAPEAGTAFPSLCEHMGSPPIFGGVRTRVAHPFSFCVMFVFTLCLVCLLLLVFLVVHSWLSLQFSLTFIYLIHLVVFVIFLFLPFDPTGEAFPFKATDCTCNFLLLVIRSDRKILSFGSTWSHL